MQDIFKQLEKAYEGLLNHTDFQAHIRALAESFINLQPLPAEHCSREIAWQKKQIKLYYYKNINKKNKKTSQTPLLIIYAFVNRPGILDLQPDRSFIKKLLEHHSNIYLLDWGSPDEDDKNNDLDFYLNSIIHQVIKKISAQHKIKKINLMGICQGGVLSLCYAALHPDKISKLVTVITPVDFHAGDKKFNKNNLLYGYLKALDSKALWQRVGNIPGFWLANSMQGLKLFRHLDPRLSPGNQPDPDFFMRLERWVNDCPDHPGKLFHEFIQQFFQRNTLIKNQLKVKNKMIDLSQLTMPILNIYAQEDHLIPAASSRALKYYHGSLNYSEISYPAGHIGLLVSKKALALVPRRISAWLGR